MAITKRMKSLTARSAVPVGLLASGALVLAFSNAAFTAQTTNDGNNWATGDVSLSSNATAPLFHSTAATHDGDGSDGAADGVMLPGQTLTNSIQINYTGASGATVKLYTSGNESGDVAELAPYLDLTITDTDDGSADFKGTLADLLELDGYDTSTMAWTTEAGTSEVPASNTYTFKVTLKQDAPAAATNKSIDDVDLVWEAQAAA